MRLGHGLRAFGEIFFEEFAKQFPLVVPEEGLGLEREFKSSFVQVWVDDFVQFIS